jgi:hypothetical protein
MRTLLLTALLLPAVAFGQELTSADLEGTPGLKETGAETVRRPDTQRIMSELSAGLRLSSKQEDRIGSAVKKKASEFDRLMKEYERYAAEEKKWRLKANEARYGMLKINRDLPDTVREFLDDEQRESFDALLDAAAKPAGPAAKPAAQRPAAKKKILKRKKAAAPAPADEEAGQVMVDGDTPKAAPKKKVLKKKAPAAVPAEEADDAEVGSYP